MPHRDMNEAATDGSDQPALGEVEHDMGAHARSMDDVVADYRQRWQHWQTTRRRTTRCGASTGLTVHRSIHTPHEMTTHEPHMNTSPPRATISQEAMPNDEVVVDDSAAKETHKHVWLTHSAATERDTLSGTRTSSSPHRITTYIEQSNGTEAVSPLEQQQQQLTSSPAHRALSVFSSAWPIRSGGGTRSQSAGESIGGLYSRVRRFATRVHQRWRSAAIVPPPSPISTLPSSSSSSSSFSEASAAREEKEEERVSMNACSETTMPRCHDASAPTNHSQPLHATHGAPHHITHNAPTAVKGSKQKDTHTGHNRMWALQRAAPTSAADDVRRMQHSLRHLLTCTRHHARGRPYKVDDDDDDDDTKTKATTRDRELWRPQHTDEENGEVRKEEKETEEEEHNVARRRVYEEVVREVCESAVRHALRRRLDDAQGATTRALGEGVMELVLRACDAPDNEPHRHDPSNPNNMKYMNEVMPSSSHTHTLHSAAQSHETRVNHSFDSPPRCTRGVLAHIRSGQPVSLCHLALDTEDDAVLTRVVQNSSSDATAVTLPSGGFSMSYAHLATLRRGCWLNDQVINLYLELLCCSSGGQSGGAASLGTHFYAKVETELQRLRAQKESSTVERTSSRREAYIKYNNDEYDDSDEDGENDNDEEAIALPELPANSALLRWLRRRTHLLADYAPPQEHRDESSADKSDASQDAAAPAVRLVLIPVNLSAQHWALVVWNKELHTLYYYDSLCGTSCSSDHSCRGRNDEYGSSSSSAAAAASPSPLPQACTNGYRRAQRILCELSHVLYECRRHLLLLPPRAARVDAAPAASITRLRPVCAKEGVADAADGPLLCSTRTPRQNEAKTVHKDEDNEQGGSRNSRRSRRWLRRVVAMPYTSWRDGARGSDAHSPLHRVNSADTRLNPMKEEEEEKEKRDYAPYSSRRAMHEAEEDFRTRLREHERYVAEYRTHRHNNSRRRRRSLRECDDDADAAWRAGGGRGTAQEGVPVRGVAGMSMSEAEVDWFVAGFAKTAQQQNGSDCGVFVCQTAWCAVEGVAVDYAQSDIPLLRQVILLELWSKKLLRRLRCHRTPSSTNI